MRLRLSLPVDCRLAAVARSHGWYDLPPFNWDGITLRVVAELDGAVHEIGITEEDSQLLVQCRSTAKATPSAIRCIVTNMLRLDEDLAQFYELADGDPRLQYARKSGVGRLLRAPTAFEDVIKMLLTTNCSWSLTKLMVSRLVEQLGQPGPTGAKAFPTPAVMAQKDERFYREQVRAGYRAPHLMTLARSVVAGTIDPEAWRHDGSDDLILRAGLLSLPGIGPYAADNLLRLLGHYGYLGLDSWCRSELKALYPRMRKVDVFAARRYRPFGRFAGLAMWLDVTKRWHAPQAPRTSTV